MTTAMKAIVMADREQNGFLKATFIPNIALAADVQPYFHSCCGHGHINKKGGENKAKQKSSQTKVSQYHRAESSPSHCAMLQRKEEKMLQREKTEPGMT